MVVYPIGESLSVRSSLPQVSTTVATLMVVLHLVLIAQFSQDYQEEQTRLKQELDLNLDQLAEQGKLEGELAFLAISNPSIIVTPEYEGVYPEHIRLLYGQYSQLESPAQKLLQHSFPQSLAVFLTPPDLVSAIFIFVVLVFCGFVFEHIYHNVTAALLILISGMAFTHLSGLFASVFFPPASHAIFYTVAVYLFIPFLLYPRTRLRLSFWTWLGRPIQKDFSAPLAIFPLAYLLFAFLSILLVPERVQQFHAKNLVFFLAYFSFVFALFKSHLIPLAEEITRVNVTTFAHSLMAEVERLFEAEEWDKAQNILKSIPQEQLEGELLVRLGEIAWRQNRTDLAEQCLKRRLHLSKNFQEQVDVVEEMAFRGMPLPDSILLSIAEKALVTRKFQIVRNLLPAMNEHKKISETQMRDIVKRFIDKLEEGERVDVPLLQELKYWLELEPGFKAEVSRIDQIFLDTVSTRDLDDQTMPQITIQKHVCPEILAVNKTGVSIDSNGKEQTVPWTAIRGIFGANIGTGTKSPVGSILVRQNNRLFSCQIQQEQIRIKDSFNLDLTFNMLWDLLEEHAPGDLPFRRISDFTHVSDEKDFREKLSSFCDDAFN